jgi:hypothetical protein
MNGLLDAALDYAARGLPVYPVHWPRPTPGGASPACSCPRGPGCDRPAKHPLTRHGVKDATTNPQTIRGWWRRWPHANVGLATGIVFDVLDVDGPAGLAALRQFARAAGITLTGPVVRTGGRGWHYWFHPTGLGCRPPKGLACVDWRGRGGAVLAPPSRHATGGSYHWLVALDDRPLPEVPGPLRALLDSPAPPRAPAGTPARPVEVGHPYGRQVLADELAILRQAQPRTRNHTLNRAAFKVYRYVAGGVLDDHDVTAAFTQTALAIGLDTAEIRRTLASARSAGLANPRGVPAPDQPEVGA